MAVRRVEIRIVADDTDAVRKLDDVKAKVDELSKKSPTIKIGIDTASMAKLDKLKLSLDDIGKKSAVAHVRIDGIDEAIAKAAVLERSLDRINGRRVRSTISERDSGKRKDLEGIVRDVADKSSRGGSWLSRLLHLGGGGGGGLGSDLGSAAGAGGSGAGSGLLSAVGGANNQYFGALVAALIGTAAAIGPAIVPLGLGGLVGAAGAYGAYKIDPKAFTKDLKSAESEFLSSLTQKAPPGYTTRSTGTSDILKFQSAGPSFMQGITAMLKQLGQFIKQMGPELGGLFRASLPTLNLFMKSIETLAKLLMPALTQSLNMLKPDLPIISQGFKYLSQGIADFIKDLGPGMKDGAIVFKAVMDGVKGILIGLAYAFDGLAKFLVTWVEKAKVDAHEFASLWDTARHETAVIFDGMRHDISNIWDLMWENTWGRSQRGVNDLETLFDRGRHEYATIFDDIKQELATIWNLVWQNTVGRAIAGVALVQAKFRALASGIWNALIHLPGQLWHLAADMVDNLAKGAQSMAGKVLGFFEGLGKGILHALGSVFHFGSPSKTMFQLGQFIVQGLHNGMQSKLGSLKGLSGSIGGNVVSWIKSALSITHKPLSWLPALESLVSKESGGNPRAVDPISVGGEHATGLFQTLPSTFAEYSLGGSIYNPVADAVAGIRYLAANYGSPYNIPGLLSGTYHGYSKGGWINEPVLGVGMRSGSAYGIAENGREYVGGGGGDIYITVNGDSDPQGAARQIWLKLRDLKRNNGNRPLGLS